MPGSWPKNKDSEESKKLETELLNKEKKFFMLVNSLYQKLVLVEENDVASSFEKDIEKMQKEVIRDISFFDKFKGESELDFSNLLLVAEKHLLINRKIRILEEEIKKLRQKNSLLAEKNEF
jgi:uncharacterized protein with gpF-like domain